MKVSKIITAPIAALFVTLAVSCTTTEIRWTAVPSISPAKAVVTAPDEGGSLSLSYTIKNPIENGQISASTSTSWIGDLNYSLEGIVAFSVAENSSADPRTGLISLSYTYTHEGGKETVTTDVVIAQSCGGQPVISVQPTGVAAEREGGSYSFSYTIVNPVDDGELAVSSSSDWISDIAVSSGKVDFTVSPNTGVVRTAKIDLVYSYSSGAAEESVTIVQDYAVSAGGAIDLSEFVGTYSCTGLVLNEDYDGETVTDMGITKTWTMKIYDTGNGRLLLSGLIPDTEEYYPYDPDYDTGPYTAYATVSDKDILVSYPQFTGWSVYSYGYTLYFCWILCTKYVEGDGDDGGWWFSDQSGTCTFIYDSSNETWTSDTGLFLALNSNSYSVSSSTLTTYVDVFDKGMSFTKISSGTSAVSSPKPLKAIDEKPLHIGLKCAD